MINKNLLFYMVSISSATVFLPRAAVNQATGTISSSRYSAEQNKHLNLSTLYLGNSFSAKTGQLNWSFVQLALCPEIPVLLR